MNIEQLEYMISVAEKQSFSKASKSLHVSQSAISQSIAKLEKNLGIIIFQRLPTGVKLTGEGKILVKKASEILIKVSDFKEEVNSLKRSYSQRLNIGLVSGVYLPFLPNVIYQLNKEFPQIKISLVEKSSTEIIESIALNEIDVGLLGIYEATQRNRDIIDFIKLRKLNMFVMVNKSSFLANYKCLKPEDLKDQILVMYNGEYMNWFFAMFNNIYGPFNLLFSSHNSETITKTVRNGLAITIETEAEILTNPYVARKEVTAVELKEDITKDTFFGIAHLKKNRYLPEIKKSIEYIRDGVNKFYEEAPQTLK